MATLEEALTQLHTETAQVNPTKKQHDLARGYRDIAYVVRHASWYEDDQLVDVCAAHDRVKLIGAFLLAVAHKYHGNSAWGSVIYVQYPKLVDRFKIARVARVLAPYVHANDCGHMVSIQGTPLLAQRAEEVGIVSIISAWALYDTFNAE